MYFGETVADKNYSDVIPHIYGDQDCESGHHFGPAVRTYWLLHYVVSGKGYFKIKDREYWLKAGDIFVIPPFVETYYEADIHTPWTYIWIGFETAEALTPNFPDVIHSSVAGRIFEDIKSCKNLNMGKTEFLCGCVWRILALLCENGEEKPSYVERAVNIIHTRYESGITVREIAQSLNLERTYFSKIFKEQMGVSPKDYLMKYRMEKAYEFMAEYGYSVSVTAASVGYSDVYLFSKMFKKYYGKSPTNLIRNS